MSFGQLPNLPISRIMQRRIECLRRRAEDIGSLLRWPAPCRTGPREMRGRPLGSGCGFLGSTAHLLFAGWGNVDAVDAAACYGGGEESGCPQLIDDMVDVGEALGLVAGNGNCLRHAVEVVG